MDIPLFPLHVVLYPGSRLPLRIFEPRYRALLSDVLAGDETFGIAAIAHGMEAGGPADVHPVGTRALVQGVVRGDDGSADIVVLGTDRFRIDRRLPEDPYPRAAVTILPEERGAGAGAALADARAAVARYRVVLARFEEPVDELDVPDDPVEAAYVLASALRLDTAGHQRSLGAADAAERLRLVADAARTETTLLEQIGPPVGRIPSSYSPN